MNVDPLSCAVQTLDPVPRQNSRHQVEQHVFPFTQQTNPVNEPNLPLLDLLRQCRLLSEPSPLILFARDFATTDSGREATQPEPAPKAHVELDPIMFNF